MRVEVERHLLMIAPLLAVLMFLGTCGVQEHVVAFPTHVEALPTAWAHHDFIGVELVVKDGCLTGRGPSPSYLLIWPDGFTLDSTGNLLRISSRSGSTVATVGDKVRLSGRAVEADSDLQREISRHLKGRCEGPYYLVGDDVAVVNDESEVVSVPGTSIYFPRRKTVMTRTHGLFDTGEGHSPQFVLQLQGDCLVIEDGENYVVRWPAGFYPSVDDSGAVEVKNGGGETIARTGDKLRFRGGRHHGIDIPECDAFGMWFVNDIRNADLPVVITRHEETPGEPLNGRINGYVEIHNGCLYVRGHILVWPSDYSLREPDDNPYIVNGAELTVVQIDNSTNWASRSSDRLTLSGRKVDADDDLGRITRRKVPVHCPHGPFWFVN